MIQFLLGVTSMLWCCFQVVLLLVAVIVTTLVVIIPCWVRQRGRKLLSHLRKPDKDGQLPVTVGLFHPYCNAGGGGERVLWVAIRALQQRYSHVRCVIYTGDIDATAEDILRKARNRFNIVLPRSVEFVFLQRRHWVEASKYPYFTLLGQSLGSLVLGWEALNKFLPDVYIDTMGYAFTLPLFRYIGGCQVACYVHYPTISTDMMQRVSQRTATYNNEQFISRNPVFSNIKLVYYHIFAAMYGWMGRSSKVVMVNSSWTQGHILALWRQPDRTHIVYPPCDTDEFTALPMQDDSLQTQHTIASIAQFRPEKDHPLQIKSFHKFLNSIDSKDRDQYLLVLVGSCRDDGDAARVANLKALCQELGIQDRVKFELNVSFDVLKKILNEATIGLHTMWNEHFGIGVVEIMAAGTIILAHNSGGPKMDIVIEYEGQRTGFLAHDVDTYAAAIQEIFTLSPQGRQDICTAARKSVDRFSEKKFEQGFLDATEELFH